MQIELPYPDKELSPNARCHWSVKARVAKQAKADAYLATLAVWGHKTYSGAYPIRYRILAYPPSHRRRDDDNLIASTKNVRDSIASVMGVDDSLFHCDGVAWQESVKNGKIIIDILET